MDTVRWGTEAHHTLGDISRPEGDFFYVHDEDDDNYYGNWLTGFGFVGVRYPKSTTRAVTKDEREQLLRTEVVIG